MICLCVLSACMQHACERKLGTMSRPQSSQTWSVQLLLQQNPTQREELWAWWSNATSLKQLWNASWVLHILCFDFSMIWVPGNTLTWMVPLTCLKYVDPTYVCIIAGGGRHTAHQSDPTENLAASLLTSGSSSWPEGCELCRSASLDKKTHAQHHAFRKEAAQ